MMPNPTPTAPQIRPALACPGLLAWPWVGLLLAEVADDQAAMPTAMPR